MGREESWKGSREGEQSWAEGGAWAPSCCQRPYVPRGAPRSLPARPPLHPSSLPEKQEAGTGWLRLGGAPGVLPQCNPSPRSLTSPLLSWQNFLFTEPVHSHSLPFILNTQFLPTLHHGSPGAHSISPRRVVEQEPAHSVTTACTTPDLRFLKLMVGRRDQVKWFGAAGMVTVPGGHVRSRRQPPGLCGAYPTAVLSVSAFWEYF